MIRTLTLIAMTLTALNGALMAAPKQNFGPTRSTVAPVAFDAEEVRVLFRKAEKYGINPNLLRAALTIEVHRLDAKRAAEDPQVFEWMAEQSARVLRHMLEKTDGVHSVFKYYAAGGFFPESQEKRHRDALRFAAQAEVVFRQLEKARPWPGH